MRTRTEIEGYIKMKMIGNQAENINEILTLEVLLDIRDELVKMNKPIIVDSTCSCGEPHISDRIEHRYDGSPCYVREKR